MKRKRELFGVMAVLGAICLAFLPTPSGATAILDFGVIAPTAGSISYAGGAAPLVGAGIDVDNVVGISTPIAGNYNLVDAFLDFTTGNITGTTATSWTFGGGANTFITLVGGVDVNGDGDADDVGDIAAGTTLFAGNFGSATVTALGGTFKIAGALFGDTKDPDLLALFGMPDVGYVGNFNISFNAAGLPPGGFASTTVLSGDITNQTPEPASMLLLGSGLVGLGAFFRRKIRR